MASKVSCQTCCDWKKEAFRERVENGEDDNIWLEDLQDSANSGCLRCGVLQDILCHFWPLWRRTIDHGYDSISNLKSLFVALETYGDVGSDDYDHYYEIRAYAHWEANLDGTKPLPEIIDLDVFLKAGILSSSGLLFVPDIPPLQLFSSSVL